MNAPGIGPIRLRSHPFSPNRTYDAGREREHYRELRGSPCEPAQASPVCFYLSGRIQNSLPDLRIRLLSWIFERYFTDRCSLEIEDHYGRLNIDEAKNGRVILSLNIPHENKTHILAHVRWIRKKEGASHVKIGISFKNLDYKDVTAIERLIGLKSKDHNMMWNLWEQYYR